MREFEFRDIDRNVAYRGVIPCNDLNCPPFEFFRMLHAEIWFKNYTWLLSIKCPVHIPEKYVRRYALEQTDLLISETLSRSTRNVEIFQLLNDDSLSWKQQEKLLRGVTLSGAEFLWLNKDAQELGYLLDIYHEETYPKKFNEIKKPIVFNQKDDGSIETLGSTEMSDGEMRALLEQRKVVQARIYHRESHWHCFYFTFRGLAGEEGGVMGSKPHYHYLSDKCGIPIDDLLKMIKECNMPSSKVHIIIDR